MTYRVRSGAPDECCSPLLAPAENQMNDVVLTGFCDEVCADKNFERQLAVASALGLEWISLRFFDLGQGVRNVLAATDSDLERIRELLAAYRIRISSIGSPLGKIKLRDTDDGTANQYRPFAEYLSVEVQRICHIARVLQTPLIRGFSFYHPRGTHPADHVPEAAARLRELAGRLAADQLVLGLEVEANLIGQTGELVQRLIESAAASNLVSVFDGANLVVQGFSATDVWRQYLTLRNTLGWVHVKDYLADQAQAAPSAAAAGAFVNEAQLAAFVPAGLGDAAYRQILPDLKREAPAIRARLRQAGWQDPLVFLDLEPHLRQGGQFGGFSGADGFGIALRHLCRLLEKTGVSYQLRDWPLEN